MDIITNECPNGCGKTLFVGEGGYVTCSFRNCPEPNTFAVFERWRAALHKIAVSEGNAGFWAARKASAALADPAADVNLDSVDT